MRWRRKEKKVEIRIIYDRDKQDIKIICTPQSLKPTEIIQVMMVAIDTVNEALQKALREEKEKKKGKDSSYIF